MSTVSSRDAWESHWSQAPQSYPHAPRIISAIEQVTRLEGKRVLEVGAGSGNVGRRLSDRGAQVIFLDYASSAIRFLRCRVCSDPSGIVQADALRLPFRDGSFDVVLHQGLLEHFTEEGANTLRAENVRVLRENGLLLVDVPQRYHYYTVLKHSLMFLGFWFAGWEREFSVRQLKQWLHEGSLSVVTVYGEWMRPSIVYWMAQRFVGMFGVRLGNGHFPHPGGMGWRDSLRKKLLRRELLLNTCFCIGAIGKKLPRGLTGRQGGGDV